MRWMHLTALLVVNTVAWGNPEPDIPVTCAFDRAGNAEVSVVVDPRCFAGEPMLERWFMMADLDTRPAAELDALKKQVKDAIPEWLRFETEPEVKLAPEWSLSFTGLNGSSLKKADDPVVVRAVWKVSLPSTAKQWRVCAVKGGRYSVVVSYVLAGQALDRQPTLFPGECAYWLELPPR